MMHKMFGFITVLGDHPDNAGFAWWWHTPLGFITMAVIFIASGINIFYRGINDDLFLRVYYWIMLILSMVSILHVIENSEPRHQLQLMLSVLAIRMMYSAIKSVLVHRRTGHPQEPKD